MSDDDTLETPRLRLTPLCPSDVEWVFNHWRAPPVLGPLWGGSALSEAFVEEQLQLSEIDFQCDRFGLWGMHRTEKAPIGIVGLRHADWTRGIELIVSVDQDAWGHGLATEATRAVLLHALSTLRLREILAAVHPHARAALRVVHRAGMRPVGTAKLVSRVPMHAGSSASRLPIADERDAASTSGIPMAVFIAHTPLR